MLALDPQFFVGVVVGWCGSMFGLVLLLMVLVFFLREFVTIAPKGGEQRAWPAIPGAGGPLGSAFRPVPSMRKPESQGKETP